MFIQTEATPNPDCLKFIPSDSDKLDNLTQIYNFTDSDQDIISPLAKELFSVCNVRNVMIGQGFVSITKKSEQNWDLIKSSILITLMDYLLSPKLIISNPSSNVANNDEDSEIVRQIKELIETKVRPAVAEDGGDIIFNRFEDGTVFLELHGACSGCPSSTVTLKDGIENMLKYYIPEIQAVESV